MAETPAPALVAPPAPALLGDAAIGSATEDRLGRAGFAAHIARGILNWPAGESLCIGLHGPWGSGKSSILNMAGECLAGAGAGGRRPVIVDFQAWRFSGHGPLVPLFLGRLRNGMEMSGLGGPWAEAARQLAAYERAFDTLAAQDPVHGSAGRRGGLLSGGAEPNIDLARRNVIAAFARLPAPVVVLLDDVDRLLDAEILQVLQIIKAVADFPNTVHVLVLDPQCVDRALKRMQGESHAGFLEKIEQITFEVPEPDQAQLNRILLDGIHRVLGAGPVAARDHPRWVGMWAGVLPCLLRNLRDVKRYLNAVSFNFGLVKDGVNRVDLLLVEALHLKTPPLYRFIRENREEMTAAGESLLWKALDDAGRRAWIDNLVAQAPQVFRAGVEHALCLLFPQINSILKRHPGPGGDPSDWDRDRRLCVPGAFDYYFQGSVPRGELSSDEFDALRGSLAGRDRLITALSPFLRDGRYARAVFKLALEVAQTGDLAHLENLIAAVCETGEQLPKRLPDQSDSQIDQTIRLVLIELLDLARSNQRKDLLLRAFHDAAGAVYFPVNLAAAIWLQWHASGGFGGRSPARNPTLQPAEAEEIRELAAARIASWAEAGALSRVRSLEWILAAWDQFGGGDAAKEWVARTLEDRRHVPDFILHFGTFDLDPAGGPEAPPHRFRINTAVLGRFTDVERLRATARDILANPPGPLTQDHLDALAAFGNAAA